MSKLVSACMMVWILLTVVSCSTTKSKLDTEKKDRHPHAEHFHERADRSRG